MIITKCCTPDPTSPFRTVRAKGRTATRRVRVLEQCGTFVIEVNGLVNIDYGIFCSVTAAINAAATRH